VHREPDGSETCRRNDRYHCRLTPYLIRIDYFRRCLRGLPRPR
jgi:hypothetical protein